MSVRGLVLSLLMLLAAGVAGAEELPRVLIIGDSISNGYTPPLKELLAGEALVSHNPGNAGHTGRGLEQLDAWLGDERWDVIHFNWGLWDLAYRPNGSKTRGLDKKDGTQTWSVEEYAGHLETLVARLQKTGARLIWASTTPVPEGEPGRYAGDELKYNAAAAKIMAAHDIPVNDLHARALPRLADFQQPANVHFNRAGSRYLAEGVAEHVLRALGRDPSTKPFAGATPRLPNVVVFLVDDLGWQDTSLVLGPKATDNNRFYETPNLLRLAASGMSFTNAYASCTVCSPTRASLMTGRSPVSHGITNWIPAAGALKGRPLLPPDSVKELARSEFTLAEALREAGYATGHVGKWHLGPKDSKGADPLRNGFEHNIAGFFKGAPKSYTRPYGIPDLDAEAEKADEYLTDRLAREACRFIEERRERRFFLYFSLYGVHTPIEGRADLEKKYFAKDPSGRKSRARYAAMIESMDSALGSVLDKLRDHELEDRTVIVFTSDNGGLVSHSGPPTTCSPLRGGKGSSYEGGIRVPLVVRWPGKITAPAVSDEPVISEDLYPTILTMTATSGRLVHGRRLDGVDLTPLLAAETKRLEPRALHWHYPHYWARPNISPPGTEPHSSIRKGSLKLIFFYEERRSELYDLATDIGEKRNLAKSHPKMARELGEELRDWLAARGALTPLSEETKQPVPLPFAR